MYILSYFDWFGPIEELEDLDKKFKKHFNGSEGVEWLGRFGPQNKKFHWTYFFKAKDFNAWVNRKPVEGFKRDYNVLTHNIVEYFV